MTDIELAPLLGRVKQPLKIRRKGTVKRQALLDVIKHGGFALLAAAASPSGTEFFRNFIYANPPFASTAIYNSIRMANRRSITKTLRRRRRKNYYKFKPIKSKRNYFRTKKCSNKIVSRIIEEYD